MRDEELRRLLGSLAGPVADRVEPPDPSVVRERGRRRRRHLLAVTALVVTAALAGGGGAWIGLAGRQGPPPLPGTGPASSAPAAPSTTAPAPASSAPAATSNPAGSPATSLPLGRIERLNAVQVVGGGGAWAVGKGAILATSDGGRTWVRVWRGAEDLRDVDFVNASTGWALGDGILLGTVDGGQHWRELGQPRVGRLRRVHFSSRTEGWGVAGGATDQSGAGPMLPQGATRLVHSSDGGRSWSALEAPAPPQTVCFTAPDDGWLASGTKVWRSTDGGRGWGSRPSFTLPVPAGEPAFFAELQCAEPGAAWVRFSGGAAAAGHIPYALYASGDGGAHWRGVLAEPGTLGSLLRLPAGPGSYPGPFSVIDPTRAFLLSPTPPANTTGAVLISQGSRLHRLPGIKGATLSQPLSASFASATRGWVVGMDAAGRAMILATSDGGRSWRSQLHS